MTRFSIERALVKWIPSAIGVKCAADVPSRRPGEFVALERVGGSPSIGIDRPSVTFDVYAATRARAEELSLDLRDALMLDLMAEVPQVRSVSITGPYNFPDTESKSPRYQLTADLLTE